MKLNVLVAVATAAAMSFALSVPALAGPTGKRMHSPGITVIPNDPASVKDCTDAGGTVATKDGKTTCAIPEPAPK